MFEFERALPEEAGISSSAIMNVLMQLDKKDVPMHSLLIMRDDKLVFEKYYEPYDSTTLHRMFSISKSFTAIAVFLLIDDGLISLEDPIVRYYPEYVDENTHPFIKQTTIRNMLMMRTCHAVCTYKVDMTSNWVESFFKVKPTHKPGTVFHYDTSASHVLCHLTEKLTGKDMLTYMKDRLLKYVDFSEDSYMVKDPFGVSMGGSGLMATPMDILKVLYILDKKGTIKCSDGVTRTVLSPDLIAEATSNLTDTIATGPLPSESQGYGMFIWQNEKGGFVLYGMGGQLAISIPSQKLLVVTTADTQGMQGGTQLIYDAIYDCLLPGIDTSVIKKASEDALVSYEKLLNYSKTLKIEPPRLPESFGSTDNSESESHFTSFLENACGTTLTYTLSDDSIFESLSLSFSKDGPCRLTLTEKDKKSPQRSIAFGINKMFEGDFPKYGTRYTAGGVFTRENMLFIKVHLIGESVGSVRFYLCFEDAELVVYMKKVEETHFREYDGHLYGRLIQ